MLKEIMARIAGIVVIIIIAIIVNFVLKRIPNDSNIKRFIRKWGRIITNVATTVITILTFIFPWISSPIFDEDTLKHYRDIPPYTFRPDVTNGLLAPQNAHRYNLPKTKQITIRSRYKMISSVFKYNPK